MKPNLKIQFKMTRQKTRHLSAAHDRIEAKHTQAKTEELKKAVMYCKENNCKGWAALNTGMFPLFKDPRTVNSRLEKLDSEIIVGEGKPHLRVLTFEEERKFVQYL